MEMDRHSALWWNRRGRVAVGSHAKRCSIERCSR
jgi:hypothetical protein